METVEVLQKGGIERAEDEGAAGQDQGFPEERHSDGRPADARASDGAAEDDEGRAADRRMPSDAAAIPAIDRVLHRDHNST